MTPIASEALLLRRTLLTSRRRLGIFTSPRAGLLETFRGSAEGTRWLSLACGVSNSTARTPEGLEPAHGRPAPWEARPAQRAAARALGTSSRPAESASAASSAAAPSPSDAPSETTSLRARMLFEGSWRRLEEKFGPMGFAPPREVVWLNGAPGSGKGTNIPFIMKSRGLSRVVGMSGLLSGSPEIRAIIDRGELVPDALVLDALLDQVLSPTMNDGAGVIVDGFPRTALQVDLVKILHDRLASVAAKAADTGEEARFPRPSFKVVILYVDEEESVRRQLRRARMASLHNARVQDAGAGDLWSVRSTDASERLCRRRYQVFRAHYHTILRLKQYFPFSLIDAMGTQEECRAQIARELRYQSSLDLDAATYAEIRHLPLARDLVRSARRQLVRRLDGYKRKDPEVLRGVVDIISRDVLPLLGRCSLAGHALYRTRDPLFLSNPLAVDVAIDVLSDRGFAVGHAVETREVPIKVDLQTGNITCSSDVAHTFRITFDRENVRDLSTPLNVTTERGEDVAIGSTFIPDHLRVEDQEREAEATVVGLPPPAEGEELEAARRAYDESHPRVAIEEPDEVTNGSEEGTEGAAHAAPANVGGLAVSAQAAATAAEDLSVTAAEAARTAAAASRFAAREAVEAFAEAQIAHAAAVDDTMAATQSAADEAAAEGAAKLSARE